MPKSEADLESPFEQTSGTEVFQKKLFLNGTQILQNMLTSTSERTQFYSKLFIDGRNNN